MLKTGFMKLAGHQSDAGDAQVKPVLMRIIDEKRSPRQTGSVTDRTLLTNHFGAVGRRSGPDPRLSEVCGKARSHQARGRSAQVTASHTADRIAAAMNTALAPDCDASQPPRAPPAKRPAACAVL